MEMEARIRRIIRDEIEAVVAPLTREVAELRRNGDLTAQLRSVLVGGSPRSSSRAIPKPRKVAATSGRSTHACAVIGCKRPSRSKGYCAAHYQKRRNLVKTKRLPSDWKEDAAPHSVTDIVLPRGRAGAKALAEATK